MRNTWQIISDFCRKINAKRIAEIGVSQGKNAINVLDACKGQFDRYYLIDPDPDGVFDYNWFRNYPEARFLRLTSEEASPLIDTLDLVYIDADHRYQHVFNDIRIWFSKLRTKGIICGDDYSPHFCPGVHKAIIEHFGDSFHLEETNKSVKIWWRYA